MKEARRGGLTDVGEDLADGQGIGENRSEAELAEGKGDEGEGGVGCEDAAVANEALEAGPVRGFDPDAGVGEVRRVRLVCLRQGWDPMGRGGQDPAVQRNSHKKASLLPDQVERPGASFTLSARRGG